MNTSPRANWPFPVAPTLPAESSIETSEREAVHIGGGIHRVPELEAAIEAGKVNRSGAEVAAIDATVRAGQALAATLAAYENAGFGSHVTDPIRRAFAEVEFSLREVRS